METVFIMIFKVSPVNSSQIKPVTDTRVSFLVTVRRSRKYDNHTTRPTPSVITKLFVLVLEIKKEKENKLAWLSVFQGLLKPVNKNI